MKVKLLTVPPVEVVDITDEDLLTFLLTEEGKYNIEKNSNTFTDINGNSYKPTVSLTYKGIQIAGMRNLKDSVSRLLYILERDYL